jgi:UrcA family protein
MKALLIIAAAVMSSGVAARPPALVAQSPATERVSFADLDLTSNAGVRRLQSRVEAAAHRLCDEEGVQPLSVQLESKSCFNTARTNGLKQVARVADSRRTGAAFASAIQILQR